jgi:hypothetical protein
MNYSTSLRWLTSVLFLAAIALPSVAQEKEKKGDKPGAKPSESEMMEKMMELSKPGENHKLLARGVGTWTYTVKMWMNPDPKAPPIESRGQSVAKETMDGRFVISDHTGKFPMPGPDGKMTEMEFKGMAVEGYDNVQKKFVATWIDNMGTGIMILEGLYRDSSFIYHGEYEPIPGMKTKVREIIKVVDQNHRTFEFFEYRDGNYVKTMEMEYTRKT